MRSDDPKKTTVYRRDYTPPAFLIDQADLLFDVGEVDVIVRAKLRVQRNPEAPPSADLQLDCDGQPLTRIALDGESLPDARYELTRRSLVVRDVPDAFDLETTTRLRPSDNTALEGLYQSGNFYLTQCEAEGFRRITFFLDRPDVMTRFRTRIEADRKRFPVLLGNGNPDGAGELDSGRHWTAWDDPFPKPCYLFAMVAGQLAALDGRYRTARGDDVLLRIWSEAENLDRCDHAMQALKNAMAWDEARFGLSYDLSQYNIVVTNDFTMGAMENKGLNIFNAHYVLARPDTATDADYKNIEAVIAHEYFHNWTGNRVTCRDWFQLSLKEGLTVFRDQEFSADQHSRALKRIEDVRLLRSLQFDEDAGPMAHPVRPDSYIEINNFYTLTVYEKGAEVVRMYQTLLGRDGFRRGMDLYFERHDGHAVTCDDFRNAMADANGRDLSQFERWYQQAGTPVVEVSADYDRQARQYRMTLRQSTPPTSGQPGKQPLHIPIAVGLLDGAGNDLPLRLTGEPSAVGPTRVLELRDAEQIFQFEDIDEAPVPSLLRGFSAPVRLAFDYSAEDLAFLMAHDSDAFNRWDAGHRLALDVVLDAVKERRENRGPTLSPTYLDAFARVLADSDTDPALRAATLALPDESVIADAQDIIHVEATHEGRCWVRAELGRQLESELAELYDEATQKLGHYTNDGPAVALRALKNRCLRYLVATGRSVHYQRAASQFRDADNMTDSLAALTALVYESAPQAHSALASFEERWQSDPLVMDKWFRLQAIDPRPEALQTVQRLIRHPAFSLKNPNKVRAVIGAFAHRNARAMHRADGDGYRFVADQILAIDRLNPQVASRVAGAFNHWRRYPDALQALMRSQLERIVAEPSLSDDVGEICGKALAA